ncbi:hypothetical protein [Leeuwenhoekiella parthenopeia]|uniref:Uncharacterized protein n=1 Tax=Leeuwenhoekiella parthenopeia TaxID=2890320 RepID=A0ABS8GSA1_9FLAO|nr:hypothetical protein [Leeuwenhoekiella parthenopeia]MCC4212862.1 hypothetical protein [Leeuwenhoekiella parthenopeia]
MNLRSLILTGALLSASYAVHAQVGIGTTNPVSGALLDISATDKGLMIPRVALTGTNDTTTVTPAATTGLLVFNTATTTGSTAVSQGFYYWDGTKWVKMTIGDDDTNIYNTDGTLTETRTVNLDENTLRFDNGVGRYLNLEGALISDNNAPFLFTTDNSLRFDIDNLPVLTLDSEKQVGIGLVNPNASLHIYETTGTIASPSTGTIVLEHGNAGGESSIIFKSQSNNNSDYGYLKYSDDGSGNGSTAENSLLELGIQNDTPGLYQDDINIASTGNVGISNTAPKEKLHISGNTSTIRVDGLNTTNNTTNVVGDPMPVYVDDNGTMVLRPSLVQTYMPVDVYNFTTGNTISSSNGGGVTTTLYTSTFTLTQQSLVFINYQFSAQLFRNGGGAITDGKPRLFRGWVEVNGDTNRPLAYDTGTYANRPDSSGTYANGFYYLSGSTYVQLPAGTHTVRLFGLGYGGNFDYQILFGGTDYEHFQIIVQR